MTIVAESISQDVAHIYWTVKDLHGEIVQGGSKLTKDDFAAVKEIAELIWVIIKSQEGEGYAGQR